jgi:uncharacterized membrane protein YecN with MAPEG domain
MEFLVLPGFLAFFTFFYLFLAMRIGFMRGSPVMKIFFKMEDDISEERLNRNVRAHGNFSEYVPLFFILLLVVELASSTTYSYLLTVCCIFTYGRVAHALCFAFFGSNPFLRISGMLTTYLGLTLLSVECIKIAL